MRGWCRAESSGLVIRSERDKNSDAIVKPARKRTPFPSPPLSPLEAALTAHLKRPLNATEQGFVGRVISLFNSCTPEGNIWASDLWSLGWTGGGYSMGHLRVAPSRPQDDLEFWYFLTALATQRKFLIPKYLAGLKVPSAHQERIAQLNREREIMAWSFTLEHLGIHPPIDESAAPLELRFRISPEDLIVESRTGDEPWNLIRPGRGRDFHEASAHRFNPVARALWNSYHQSGLFFGFHHFRLNDKSAAAWLGQQLMVPAFADYFLNVDGSPLVRHAEPLRWEVTEPADPSGDVRFALQQADGQPVPPVFAYLPGHPPLYLTEAGVFPGPPSPPFPTPKEGFFQIPVPAFESQAGLQLLRAMRLPVPAGMASRTEVRRVVPRIRASLQASGLGSNLCVVQVDAVGPDGKRFQKLGQGGWHATSPSTRAGHLIQWDCTDLQGIANLMSATGFKIDPYRERFTQKVNRAFPAQFRSFLDQLPASAQVELDCELASLRDGSVVGTLRLEAEAADTDWFDLRIVVNVEDTTLTAEEVRLLVASRGQWVRLEGRGWRRLEYQLNDQEEADLARIGLTTRQLSADPQRLHALQLADPGARRFLSQKTVETVERCAAKLKARVAPEKPAAVQAELRPYQLDGFHFLAYLAANRFGGVLADDMGLGKTLQTLTWLVWLREQGAEPNRRTLPSLVVCPKSVQDNWRAEAARFTPTLRVTVWDSLTDQDVSFGAADLHVVNYAQLRQAEEALRRGEFLAAILDEGQYIKNPSSQTAQVARRLRADHRLVLTGTPIENRLLDLWSLMAFAMPGALGARAGFSRLYDAKDDPLARPRLAARVRPFLLRRTKAQVARDLPDRVEEDLYGVMEGEQKAMYRAELKAAQQHLLRLKTQDALNRDRFNLLTSLLRLRQICCHPRLLKPDAAQDGAKLEALLETLEPLIEEGEKVLVFSQFVELLDLVRQALDRRGWKHWSLTGSTENRGSLVEEFQQHSGAGVFLVSLKAGGAGLNLTAASYVVLFDPWWNPAVENQAIDRTHRIGQVRKVIAYRLLIKDSIEEKIRALQKSKRALAEEVLGEERFSAALTLDDLKFLLAD